MQRKRPLWIGAIFTALLVLAAAVVLFLRPTAPGEVRPAVPASTPDRLAAPPLPQHPTQYEWGRYLFWLNCMACHGDRGQGLTDEFRSLWVADHQNCWARGCHAGHLEDQGFPLPRTIPAIISADGKLPPFATADKLFEYLRTTHPPQHPGYLPDDQYWAISAYLLAENGRLEPGQVLGPAGQVPASDRIWRITAAGLILLLAAVIIVWLRLRRRKARWE
jgi:mono/diheme cytochrome c family protein